MDDAKWYVVHTYSGYENKVKANIEKTVENRNLHDQILEVIVPLETVVEIKDGSKKAAQKKMFPGYVLVKLVCCQKHKRCYRVCWSWIKASTTYTNRN